MFLTRFGMRSRMVICGDPNQTDLPPAQVGPGRRRRQAGRHPQACRWSASPPPTSSATRWSAGSSRPMRGRGRMMLDVAIDADAEWDSSTGWAGLAEAAAAAAIAESAFRSSAQGQRTVELSVRLAERRRGPRPERRMARQGQADQRPVLPDGRRSRAWPTAADGPELMLGDIILARGVCAAEAAEKAIPLEQPCRASDGPRHAAPARLRPYGRRQRRRHGGARSARAGAARHRRPLSRGDR